MVFRIATIIGKVGPVEYDKDLDPDMTVKELRMELAEFVKKNYMQKGVYLAWFRKLGSKKCIGGPDVCIGSCLQNGEVLRLGLMNREPQRAQKGMAYAKAYPDSRIKYQQKGGIHIESEEALDTEGAVVAGVRSCVSKCQQEGVATEVAVAAGTGIYIWTKIGNRAAVRYDKDLPPNMTVGQLRKELKLHVLAKTEGIDGKNLSSLCSLGSGMSIGNTNAKIGSCIRNGQVLRLGLRDKPGRIRIWTRVGRGVAVKYDKCLDPSMTVGQLRKELQSQIVAKTGGFEGKYIHRLTKSGLNGRSIGKADVNIGSCIAHGQMVRMILQDKAVQSARDRAWRGMAYAKAYPNSKSKYRHVSSGCG